MRLDTTYFAENWKYYSKIIFKCVNNAVRPILMKILLKKYVCKSHEQCTESIGKAWNTFLKKKKEGEMQMLDMATVSKRILN